MYISVALHKPKKKLHDRIEQLLSLADVALNGSRPWDIQVHDDNLYCAIMKNGSLGLGESYMSGWWDAERVDEFICRVLKANLQKKVNSMQDVICYLQAAVMNQQSPDRSYEVGEKHYDIGNDLYEAQEAKLDLVCRKLELRPGMRVLDIGCGWGGMAQYAAEKYDAEVVGITISREQASLARQRCKGLPVDIRLQDYRSLDETFDRILSIGMFEHVGYKNYRTYMRKVRSLLKDDGLFLLHTIGSNTSQKTTDSWIHKYIFPNSMLPSAKQISSAFEGIFVLEDWHGFGADYDTTLMHWYENFRGSWNRLKKGYDERFYRMWNYYLLSCAGSFRARYNQLWQIVLSPEGVSGGYRSPLR